MKRVLLIGLLSLIFLSGCFEQKYYYIGSIHDIEGGSSKNLIILTLEDGQKVPYTTQDKCSNKIRIGHDVYKRSDSEYLWVEYENGTFC